MVSTAKREIRRRQDDCQAGDVLGALEQVGEIAVLIVALG